MSEATNANMSTVEKANAAFAKVSIRVVERARQTKTSVVVWEDGQVKHLTADEADNDERSQDKSSNSERD